MKSLEMAAAENDHHVKTRVSYAQKTVAAREDVYFSFGGLHLTFSAQRMALDPERYLAIQDAMMKKANDKLRDALSAEYVAYNNIIVSRLADEKARSLANNPVGPLEAFFWFRDVVRLYLESWRAKTFAPRKFLTNYVIACENNRSDYALQAGMLSVGKSFYETCAVNSMGRTRDLAESCVASCGELSDLSLNMSRVCERKARLYLDLMIERDISPVWT